MSYTPIKFLRTLPFFTSYNIIYSTTFTNLPRVQYIFINSDELCLQTRNKLYVSAARGESQLARISPRSLLTPHIAVLPALALLSMLQKDFIFY
jgi:hypothetical protein